MKLATPLAVLTATLLIGSLAGCSSDSSDDAASNTPAPVEESSTPAAPSPSAEESAAPSAAPVEAGELTAPGAELSTDEPMNVLLHTGLWDSETEESVTEEIAATYTFGAVREGAAEDLSDVFGDDDIAMLSDYDIVYVDYTVSLPGGALTVPGMGINTVTELDAIDTAGVEGSGGFIFFDGGPEICAYGSTTDLAAEGTTDACQIIALTKGETLATLQFAGDTNAGEESDYEDAPIVWNVG